MSLAAACAAAHGHFELLKWLTVEQFEEHASAAHQEASILHPEPVWGATSLLRRQEADTCT